MTARRKLGTEGQGQDIVIAAEQAVCDHRGVLYFPGHELLAVSDLHLEKGSSHARRGLLMPPYDTAATLLRLQAVIDDYRPKTVVSLGDSFHDGEGAARLPDTFRGQLSALMVGRDWFWIGRLTFRHEPSATPVDGEIAGHLHPCARVVQRGRSIRRRCFASDGHRIVMPAFGAFTGSLNVLDRAYAGLFRRERLIAYLLGSDRVFGLSGSLLQPG